MSLIHNQSEPCVKSELDLFIVPMTQTSIDKNTYHQISPLSALTDNSPIEFYITGSSDQYLDLNDTHIHIQAKITNADGTDLAADTEVGFINYPGCSLFSQVDVMLGDSLISHPSNTYPYRGIIECLLNYGPDTLASQFECGLFSKDTAGQMNVTNPAGANTGLGARSAYTALSRVVDIIAPIHSDLFFQEKLLINGMDIKLKFIRSKDEFSLMATTAGDAHKVKIISASLYIKKVEVAPGVRIAHAKALTQTNIKYPIDRVCLKTVSIPNGSRVCNQENLFLGQIPKFIVIGFVDHEGFTGSYTRNPFNFHHYDLEFLSIHTDGQSYPGRPLQPSFNNGQYGREYYQMIQATGRHLKDRGLAITRKDFGSGYTLFCFNLEPDGGCGSHVSLIRSGNLRLEGRFRNALDRTVNMICYAIYDSVIEISNRRQVLLDFY